MVYHNHFQNFKVYQIPKAQLIIFELSKMEKQQQTLFSA